MKVRPVAGGKTEVHGAKRCREIQTKQTTTEARAFHSKAHDPTCIQACEDSVAGTEVDVHVCRRGWRQDPSQLAGWLTGGE